jgi:uncharacterized membrane protein YdjX (TVP38/TMEM64 family)
MKKYFLPICLIIFVLLIVFMSGKYLSFNDFIQYKQTIIAYTEQHYFIALIGFFMLYTLAVAFSFPGALALTLMGGFIFGTFVGGLTIILAATLGATLLFLTARHFATQFLPKVGGKLDAFRDGFNKDAFNYLLFLRLTPVFPFWLVNLAPAFLNVPLKTYVIATLIGIAPGTLIFASLGAGAGDLIGTDSFKLSPTLLAGLAGLGLLSLLPILMKRVKS